MSAPTRADTTRLRGVRVSPPGDRGGDEGDEDDRPGGGDRHGGEGDGGDDQGESAALDGNAEALGGVVPEQHDLQPPGQGDDDRHQDEHGDADRADVGPAAPVEAAGEPHHGPLGLEDLGPVRAGTASPPRASPPARCRRARGGRATRRPSRPARRSRWRRRATPRSAPAAVTVDDVSSTTMQNTAAALAPESMPMMSGLASGLRAMLWKMAPEIPKAAPTRMAVIARGRRSVRTMNSDCSSPAPKIAGTTSRERDREVADADRDAEDDRQRDDDAGGDDRRAGGAAALHPPGAGGDGQGRHSSASFRRRTR